MFRTDHPTICDELSRPKIKVVQASGTSNIGGQMVLCLSHCTMYYVALGCNKSPQLGFCIIKKFSWGFGL